PAIPVARPVAAPRSLGYAVPGAQLLSERALGDSDVAWVLSLRNAARLMVIAIVFDYLAWICLPGDDVTKGLILVVYAALNVLASWYLTTREPGVADIEETAFSARVALRVAATLAGAAQLLHAGAELPTPPVSSRSRRGPTSSPGRWRCF